MFSRKADGPLSVEIPTAKMDRPSWSRVGVIAAVGFLIGVAWPRLAGVRLGPSVPETASSVATTGAHGPGQSTGSTEPSVGSVPSSSPASLVTGPSTPTASAPGPASISVTVSHGAIFACRTDDGKTKKGSDCGTLPGFDAVVMPRLRKLAECPGVENAVGKVHLVVHADFTKGALNVERSHSHAGDPSSAEMAACAKTDVMGVELAGVTNENPKYSLAYTVTVASGGSSAPSAAAVSAVVPAKDDESGATQVVWDVAIVRDAPKTGKVIARLPRGSDLHLGAAKDGWYPVKFGDGFTSEGWVYRGAIGK